MNKTKKIYLILLLMVVFYWALFHLKNAVGGSAALTTSGQLSSDLADQFPNLTAGKEISVLVFLKKQADFDILQINKGQFPRTNVYRSVLETLKMTAGSEQADLLTKLNSWKREGKVKEIKSFWVANVVSLRANRETIEELKDDPAVEMIYPDYPL
jgi:hypothetical protein